MLLAGALLSGLLFGAGLTISQMINPARVIGFLDVTGAWDPTLALVMAGALAVTAVAFPFILGRKHPLYCDEFDLPVKTAIDRRLLSGAVIFGIGWGFFDCNNMPILSQIARPQVLATGYGFMNMVSISMGGFGDWGFGFLRDHHVPLNVIFGAFAGLALVSVVIVLLIRPRHAA